MTPRRLKYDRDKPITRYHAILIAVFAIVWVWAAIRPKHLDDWFLENILIFLFVPLILATGRYFRLSLISYTLLTIFMCLHVYASHYTYAEAPLGYWLQNLFGTERNMYDRVIHFMFGFLLAYPVREIFLRLAKVKGFWGYYLPFDVALSLSALYEIIEWGVASIVDPSAGTAFLGTQGDEWDAQRDMAAAGMGAFIAMFSIMLFNSRHDKSFWKDWRASFRLRRGDGPLGEIELKRLLEGDQNN